MIIYKITNIITQKIYIGLTIQKLKRRWMKHIHDSEISDQVLYRAMRKYGIENFKIEIIETLKNSTIESLCAREIHWIKTMGSLIPSGYNMNSGGVGFYLSEEAKAKLKGKPPPNKGKKMSEEQRKLLSLIKTEMYSNPDYKNPNYGQSRTPEQVKNIRNGVSTRRSYNGKGHPMFGRIHKEESKNKMRKAKIKSPVFCITNGVTYSSAQEAENILGINNVGAVCRGVIEQTKGYKFKFANKESA